MFKIVYYASPLDGRCLDSCSQIVDATEDPTPRWDGASENTETHSFPHRESPRCSFVVLIRNVS